MFIEVFGLLFSMILGTVGHFLYELANKNRIIGFFFSKDESLTQHLKLGITPILLWTIIELFTSNLNNLFFAKFISILVFIFSLIILYYGYKFIFKKNILFLDILIFYISLTLAYFVSINLLLSNNLGFILNLTGFLGLISVLVSYIIFN